MSQFSSKEEYEQWKEIKKSSHPAALTQLTDPVEKTAFIALAVMSIPVWILIILWILAGRGAPLLFIGGYFIIRYIAELFSAAFIKTNAVEVSDGQYPEIYEIIKSCALRLDMEIPKVYIMQENIWNAFATKLAGKRLVVLMSGAIDSLLLKGSIDQLSFLVGHEFGHHHAGHLDWSKKIALLGGWVPWLLLWYKRRGELTCDRIGCFCSGSLETSLAAVANMTVGAQLAATLNVAEAIQQWENHRREFFVKYRTLYSTHPHHLWRLAELQRNAQLLLMTEPVSPTPVPQSGVSP